MATYIKIRRNVPDGIAPREGEPVVQADGEGWVLKVGDGTTPVEDLPSLNGIDGIDGDDGVSVTSAEVDSEGLLTITLSDSTVLGPWAVAGEDGEDGAPGIVTYTSTAEVDAVEVTETGILTDPDRDALSAWTGGLLPSGLQIDVQVRSILSDGYSGGGYKPTTAWGYAAMTQTLDAVGDYGSTMPLLSRYREWYADGDGNPNGSNGSYWGDWSPWVADPKLERAPGDRYNVPLIAARSMDANDANGVLVDFNDADPGWRNNNAIPTTAYLSRFAPELYGDEGGRIRMRHDGADLSDFGTPTVVGNQSFQFRTPTSGNTRDKFSCIQIDAGAASANAVAGIAIPLDALTSAGFAFLADFSVHSGATASTRLFGGIVEASDVAAMLTDVDPDPSVYSPIFGAGYRSADTNVMEFEGRATSAINDIGVARRTSFTGPRNHQRIRIGMRVLPQTVLNAARYAAVTTSGFYPMQGIAGGFAQYANPWINSGSVWFVLRASAGGVSARPIVNLYALSYSIDPQGQGQ